MRLLLELVLEFVSKLWFGRRVIFCVLFVSRGPLLASCLRKCGLLSHLIGISMSLRRAWWCRSSTDLITTFLVANMLSIGLTAWWTVLWHNSKISYLEVPWVCWSTHGSIFSWAFLSISPIKVQPHVQESLGKPFIDTSFDSTLILPLFKLFTFWSKKFWYFPSTDWFNQNPLKITKMVFLLLTLRFVLCRPQPWRGCFGFGVCTSLRISTPRLNNFARV